MASGGWCARLYPYVKSAAVYTCPDDNMQRFPWAPKKISYAYNGTINSTQPFWVWTVNNGVYGNTGTATEATLSSPSNTVLIYEANGWLGGSTSYPEPLGSSTSNYWNINNGDVTDPNETSDIVGEGANHAYQAPVAADRHQNYTLTGTTLVGGANFVLADGHAKWLRVSDENFGAGAQVSVGDPLGFTGATCTSPDKLGGTSYTATFCTQ